jgi:hypothetical protein
MNQRVIENDFDTGIGFSWHPRCASPDEKRSDGTRDRNHFISISMGIFGFIKKMFTSLKNKF